MLKLNGYGGPQAKANEKRLRFKGWETLVTYYAPSGGIDIGSKSELKMNFERFPEMVELIKSKDFSVKEMKDKPFAMLETLDQYLAK